MRRWIPVSLATTAALALAFAPARAQDAQALRQELERMRRQFESMKESYEKAINALGYTSFVCLLAPFDFFDNG